MTAATTSVNTNMNTPHSNLLRLFCDRFPLPNTTALSASQRGRTAPVTLDSILIPSPSSRLCGLCWVLFHKPYRTCSQVFLPTNQELFQFLNMARLLSFSLSLHIVHPPPISDLSVRDLFITLQESSPKSQGSPRLSPLHTLLMDPTDWPPSSSTIPACQLPHATCSSTNLPGAYPYLYLCASVRHDCLPPSCLCSFYSPASFLSNAISSMRSLLSHHQPPMLFAQSLFEVPTQLCYVSPHFVQLCVTDEVCLPLPPSLDQLLHGDTLFLASVSTQGLVHCLAYSRHR